MNSAFFYFQKNLVKSHKILYDPHCFNEKIVRQIFLVKSAEERNFKCGKQRKLEKIKKTNKRTTPWADTEKLKKITPALIRKLCFMTSIVLTRKLSVRIIFFFTKSAEESNYEWKQRKVEDKIKNHNLIWYRKNLIKLPKKIWSF